MFLLATLSSEENCILGGTVNWVQPLLSIVLSPYVINHARNALILTSYIPFHLLGENIVHLDISTDHVMWNWLCL